MVKGLERTGINERPAKQSRLDNEDVIAANRISITHTEEDINVFPEGPMANDTCASTPTVSTPPDTCESSKSVEIVSDTIPMATRVCGFTHLNHDLLPSVLLPASKWKDHIDISQIDESCSSMSPCVKPDRDRHAAERSYAECQEELAELKVDYKELQEELEWKEGIEIELKEVKEELRSREQREEERRDMITVLGASGFDRSFLEEHAPTPPSVTNDNNKRVNEVRNLNQEVEGSRRRVVALEGRIQGQEEELVKMRLKHSKTNEKLGQVVMEKDGLLKELEILKRRLVEQEQGKEATLSISGNVMGKSKESREKEVIDLCED